MGQITATRNLVAIKVVRHAGQSGSVSKFVALLGVIVSLKCKSDINKANLRDLIAATGLVIVPKLDPNRQLFGRPGVTLTLDRWRKTIEPLPCPQKLNMSFHSHPIIWIRVTNRKRSNQSQIVSFSLRVTLKFSRWSWKTKRCLFSATSMFHFLAIGEFKLEFHGDFFVPCGLEISRTT